MNDRTVNIQTIMDVTSLREGTHYYPKDGTRQLWGEGTLYGYIESDRCYVKIDIEAFDERNNKWIELKCIFTNIYYAIGSFMDYTPGCFSYELGNFVFNKHRLKVKVSKQKESTVASGLVIDVMIEEIVFLNRLKIVVL